MRRSASSLAHDRSNGAGPPGTCQDRELEGDEDMLAFDQLSPGLRRVLRALPFKMSSPAVLEVARERGEREAVVALRGLTMSHMLRSERERSLRTGICRD